MHFSKVIFTKTIHIGDHNFVKAGTEITMEINENPIDAMNAARDFVLESLSRELGQEPYSKPYVPVPSLPIEKEKELEEEINKEYEKVKLLIIKSKDIKEALKIAKENGFGSHVGIKEFIANTFIK